MELTSFINEIITQELEEAKFNPELLNSPNFKDGVAKAQFLRDVVGLQELGAGSSRVVFVLDSRRVIKLAFTASGNAQNKAEVVIAGNPTIAPVVTRIFKHSQDFSWLLAEIVRPLDSAAEFFQLTGVPWMVFRDVLENSIQSRSFEEGADDTLYGYEQKVRIPAWKNSIYAGFITNFGSYMKTPFFKSTVEAILGSPKRLLPGDLTKSVGSWGKTPDQRVVLLDYGFTDEVYRDHYQMESRG